MGLFTVRLIPKINLNVAIKEYLDPTVEVQKQFRQEARKLSSVFSSAAAPITWTILRYPMWVNISFGNM